MKKIVFFLCLFTLIFVEVRNVKATQLTFDDPTNLGVNLGGSMQWNSTGGGHLFCERWTDNDYIIFLSNSTYVNNFEMNGLPWENYGGGVIDLIDIAAFNSSNQEMWGTTVDLSGYTDWSNWLNVSVETGNISTMTFYATGSWPSHYGFWPSIDNMVINENAPVPEPSTILLFVFGFLGLLSVSGIKKRVWKG